jgi:methyltransferase-like protein
MENYSKTITYRQWRLSIFSHENGQGRQDVTIEEGNYGA